MPIKRIEVAGVGNVVLQKRRGSRSVRLSLSHDGSVRVTLPYWVPYQAGLSFVRSKTNWIATHQQRLKPIYRNGQLIGKLHYLNLVQIEDGMNIKTSLRNNLAIVKIPHNLAHQERNILKAVHNVSIRALRQEAESLLPSRLQKLASSHGFKYKSVAIRSLQSRWGSCNQHGDITLNLFLMQLPWDLIDYILLHELTHTKVMRHGKPFWDEMRVHTDNLTFLRKAVLKYRPVL